VCVICHSYLINKNGTRTKWPFVRICADSAALAAIFGAMMVIASYYRSTLTKSAVCYDLFWNGISDLIIQLCDNLSFLNRFQAVHKVPKWKSYAIYAYISLIMVLTWLPTYTVYPFFVDTNSASFLEASIFLLGIDGWGSIAYNFYFTVEFTVVLYKVSFEGPGSNSRTQEAVKMIAYKSIIHCVTSSLAILVYVYIPVYGVLIYSIIIICMLHFLFNFKVEKLVRTTTRKIVVGISSGRSSSQKKLVIPSSGIASQKSLKGGNSAGNLYMKKAKQPANMITLASSTPRVNLFNSVTREND